MKPDYWNKQLRLPVLAPDDKKIKDAKIVFVVGDAARKALLPKAEYQDAIAGIKNHEQLIVGFFPGKKNSNLELVQQLLARMDEKYPYIGGIKNRWALRIKMYGKTFDKNKPLVKQKP
jgi:hypothetical protein